MKPGLYVATVRCVEGVRVHGPDPDDEFVILTHLEDRALGLGFDEFDDVEVLSEGWKP